MPVDYRKRTAAPASSSSSGDRDSDAGRLVACVQADSSGPAHGALTFRVGTADETVPTRGITHLVEHLVMRAAHDPDVRANAGVGLTRTTFWASGTEDEVVAFLHRVERALRDLPVEHLDSERDLIGVEEEHHPVSLPSPVQHFGAQRYGVVWFEQQLAHLDPARLRAWAGTWFTAANAVLTLVGVDRGRAAIRLPEGRFHPEPPVHRPDAGPALHVDPGERTISLSALLPASWAVAVLVAVLDRAVVNRLRHVEHLAYGARADLLRVTLDTTMVCVTSDCVAGREDDLVAALLDEVRTLEFSEETVLRAVGRVVAEAEEGAGTTGLTEAAWSVLHGRDVPASVATMAADLDALTGAQLSGLRDTVLATCVLRTPVPVHPDGPWRVPTPPVPWTGREFTARDGRRLTVSATGVQVGDVQVTWSSIAAAFVTDDVWTLVSRRGVRLDVRPAEFPGVLDELHDRVPTAVRVPGTWRRARV